MTFIDNSPLMLAGATFITIMILVLALSSFLSALNKDRYLVNRIQKWSRGGNDTSSSGGTAQPPKSGIFALLKSSGKNRKEMAAAIYADTPLFYQRAGIYNKRKIRSYQTLRYLLLLAPVVALTVSHFLSHRPLSGTLILAALVIGYAGYYLPVLWLRLVGRARKKVLNRAFPDAIDLLMVCVEAGMGLDSAIRRVSREIHVTSPELAKEFKILSLELKTGKSRNDCLKNLAKRTDLPDVNNLVNLLIQADKYGTGVANALRIHAEEMRQKRYARLEELAAKLPVKLVVPLVLFIFPALFVVIVGPAAIRIFRVLIQG